MRGYFGVGVDGISKPMNLGNVSRIANAFDASFFFTLNAKVKFSDAESDTSRAQKSMPYYQFAAIEEFRLPAGCKLVAVEITEDAIELPRFRHPLRAAYVFGAERLSISPAMLARADYTVKIPMKFSINVGMAASIVLYDRLITLGGYPPRPVSEGGKAPELPPPHQWGAPLVRDTR